METLIFLVGSTCHCCGIFRVLNDPSWGSWPCRLNSITRFFGFVVLFVISYFVFNKETLFFWKILLDYFFNFLMVKKLAKTLFNIEELCFYFHTVIFLELLYCRGRCVSILRTMNTWMNYFSALRWEFINVLNIWSKLPGGFILLVFLQLRVLWIWDLCWRCLRGRCAMFEGLWGCMWD